MMKRMMTFIQPLFFLLICRWDQVLENNMVNNMIYL